MGQGNFTEDFKLDAIKQITERGHSVADVSKHHRLAQSWYSWPIPALILAGFMAGFATRPQKSVLSKGA
jgi:hypothetical protein